jgi:hypothetical protein
MGAKLRAVKVQNNSDNITPFAGLNFISNDFDKSELSKVIEKELPNKSKLATYTLNDDIKSMFLTFFAGGDCAEDMNEHLKSTLLTIKNLKVPNADTVLRDLKKLSTPTTTFTSHTKVEHQTNLNDKLNNLIIKSLLKLNLIKTEHKHDFDYDNQVIPCEKYDSKMSYKKKNAYQPGIATIGRHIVYIENRNGNSPAKFQQAETLKKCYEKLKENGIKIGRSRMDSASYQKDVIEIVSENSDLFYIRANRCCGMENQIREVKTWQKVSIGVNNYEIASITYSPFNEKKDYRVVVSREPLTNGDLLTDSHFSYRGIITNDLTSSDLEVLTYYNQRGGQEIILDEMNNDFGWKKLPFSFLNENTVFMSIMAVCRSFYIYIIEKYSKVISFLSPNFRLKKFRFRFINVAGKWIKRGREQVLKLFTDKEYYKLC